MESEALRGIFVENGDYYQMEEAKIQIDPNREIVQIGTDGGGNFEVVAILENGFVDSDVVVVGYFDVDGACQSGLVFVIKGSDLLNKEVEFENIMDSADSQEEVEDWIINNTQTNLIEYF